VFRKGNPGKQAIEGISPQVNRPSLQANLHLQFTPDKEQGATVKYAPPSHFTRQARNYELNQFFGKEFEPIKQKELFLR
jgi:hypothetical protein